MGGGRRGRHSGGAGRPPARATASPPPTTPLLLPAWPPSRRATTGGGAELDEGTRFGPVSPFGLSPCHAGERTVHSIELTVTQLGPDLSRRVMIPPEIDRGRTRGQDLRISMMLMSQKGAHRYHWHECAAESSGTPMAAGVQASRPQPGGGGLGGQLWEPATGRSRGWWTSEHSSNWTTACWYYRFQSTGDKGVFLKERKPKMSRGRAEKDAQENHICQWQVTALAVWCKKETSNPAVRVPARSTCAVVCTEVGPRALADAPRPSFLVPPRRPAKPQAPCHKRALGRGSLKSNPFGYVLDPLA